MQSITVRNVNHALPRALALLRDTGKLIAPRGMKTLELEGPFATTYELPEEMVVFDGKRDANPFFHFFEALWILAGRDDVGFLAHFLPRMADFSDDGLTFHAPYGHRLRQPEDQIELAIEKLKADKDSRQAVLSIWDPRRDWARTRDVPCNSLLMFKVRDGKLRLTVCNRSNDVILGAYGANVVQFSTLLAYMAARIGVGVGTYTQVSDSFHVYEDNPFWMQWLAEHTSGVPPVLHDFYEEYELEKDSFFLQPEVIRDGMFDVDLKRFFTVWDEGALPTQSTLYQTYIPRAELMDERWYLTDAFSQTVLPMLETFTQWKAGNRELALSETAKKINAQDWRLAATRWMARRLERGAAPDPAEPADQRPKVKSKKLKDKTT